MNRASCTPGQDKTAQARRVLERGLEALPGHEVLQAALEAARCP